MQLRFLQLRGRCLLLLRRGLRLLQLRRRDGMQRSTLGVETSECIPPDQQCLRKRLQNETSEGIPPDQQRL